MDTPQSVTILKVLADPMRLVILSHFKENVPVRCGDILAGCPRSQPTVSHHLGKLAEAGILNEYKNGTQKTYTLNWELLTTMGIDLSTLISTLPVT